MAADFYCETFLPFQKGAFAESHLAAIWLAGGNFGCFICDGVGEGEVRAYSVSRKSLKFI